MSGPGAADQKTDAPRDKITELRDSGQNRGGLRCLMRPDAAQKHQGQKAEQCDGRGGQDRNIFRCAASG